MILKRILLISMLYLSTTRSQEMKDMSPNEYMRFLRMINLLSSMNKNASNEYTLYPPFYMTPTVDSNTYDPDYVPFMQYDTKRMTMGSPLRPFYFMPPMDTSSSSKQDFSPFMPPKDTGKDTNFSNEQNFGGSRGDIVPSDSDKDPFLNQTNHLGTPSPDVNKMPLLPLRPFWPHLMPPIMWHESDSDDAKHNVMPFMPNSNNMSVMNSFNDHHLGPPGIGNFSPHVGMMPLFPRTPFWIHIMPPIMWHESDTGNAEHDFMPFMPNNNNPDMNSSNDHHATPPGLNKEHNSNPNDYMGNSEPDVNKMLPFPVDPFWANFMPPMAGSGSGIEQDSVPFMGENHKKYDVESPQNKRPSDSNRDLDTNPTNNYGESSLNTYQMPSLPQNQQWSPSMPPMTDSSSQEDDFLPFMAVNNKNPVMYPSYSHGKLPSSLNKDMISDPTYVMSNPFPRLNKQPPLKSPIPVETYFKNEISRNSFNNDQKHQEHREFAAFLTDYQHWLKRNDNKGHYTKRESINNRGENYNYNSEFEHYPLMVNNYYDEPENGNSKVHLFLKSFPENSGGSLIPYLYKPYIQSQPQSYDHQKDVIRSADYYGQYPRPPLSREQKYLVNVKNYNSN